MGVKPPNPSDNSNPVAKLPSGADLEPVDCAAVDQRREHAQSTAERISDWTHRQDDMKLISTQLDEHVKQCRRRTIGLLQLLSLPSHPHRSIR